MSLQINHPDSSPKLFGEWDKLKIDVPTEEETKQKKVYDEKMYSIIYRLRKYSINIDTPGRTIYYTDPEEINRKGVRRLCSEFGFVRQSQF